MWIRRVIYVFLVLVWLVSVLSFLRVSFGNTTSINCSQDPLVRTAASNTSTTRIIITSEDYSPEEVPSLTTSAPSVTTGTVITTGTLKLVKNGGGSGSRYYHREEGWVTLENDNGTGCYQLTKEDNMVETFWNSLMTEADLGSCQAETPNFAEFSDGVLTINCPDGDPAYRVSDQKVPPLLRPYDVANETAGVSIPEKYEWMAATCDLPYIGPKENYFVQHIKNEKAATRALEYEGPRGLDVNVLFILMDDISKNQFKRSLKSTYKVLTSDYTNDYKNPKGSRVFNFERYNIVGPNSLPNQLPMFTGKSVRAGMIDSAQYDMIFSSTADDTWLWNYYKKRGYVTLYGIETCKPPFQNSDPDHMFSRTFYCDKKQGGADASSGRVMKRGTKSCLGDRPVHHFMFDYVRQHLKHYKGVRHFTVASWMTAHEKSLLRGKFIDADMTKFLLELRDSNSLNDTIVIFLSDHGSHSDFLLGLLEGNLEHRNPPLFISIPRWICSKYPELCDNLHENQNRLVTAHDIYATLRHIPVYPSKAPLTNQHSFSLFDQVDPERSCSKASIPKELCGCLAKTESG